MNWYKKAQLVYRGDPATLNLEDFDPEYGVNVLGKQQAASAAWGPGIYFADKEDVALMYGKNLTTRKLQNANILTTNLPKFSLEQIKNIINGIDRETIELASSNWNENHEQGKIMLMNSIMNAENPIDQLMNIWAEIFNHQSPNKFMQLMTNKGIDGISVNKDDVTYYVIYNRNILKSTTQ